MKKATLLTLTVLLTANLFSQSFDVANLRAGGGLVYASEISNIGLTFNGTYEITEQWEASIAFTHIFEKDYLKWNVLDLDGHYVFYQHDEKLNVYGLAGLSLNFWKAAISIGGITFPEQTGSNVGFNLGMGANYKLTNNLNLAPEMRFTLMDGSYFRIGVALQYMF